jgi:hypothetical protein
MMSSSNDFAPAGRRRLTTCRSPGMGGGSTARRLSSPGSPKWRRIAPPVATSSSMTTEPPPLDIDRILDVLYRHEVEFLLVGGVAAIVYGARRPTTDLDCVTPRTEDNLNRLAAALRALNARLRVHGLTDDEAAALPTQLDAETLARMEISTWRTDAGDLDVLTDIPSRDGRRVRYAELVGRANSSRVHGVAVQVVALPDLIASKEWANRPKDRDALPELRQIASQGD